MTLDELQRRDTRIAALEACGPARTIAEQDELHRLQAARDLFWRRLPHAIERTRRKARELDAYARQHRLDLERIRA